jgi:drug/metabolite transporter (DMT)-like permease
MIDRAQWVVLACVIVMTTGQVLFKQVAVNYNKIGAFWDIRVIGILFVAGILYVSSSLLWVWALRYVDISRAYPYFALGFVFVPLFGMLIFGETLTLKYAIGVLLIVAGVWTTTST